MLLALLVANASGLAVALLIPFMIAPREYAVFSIAWGSGQLLAAICFEWLRYGVVRYSASQDQEKSNRRRSLITFFYLVVAVLLVTVALFAIGFNSASDIFSLISTTCIYAACQGLFEGRQAALRSEFRNRSYSTSWIIRSVISLCLSLIAAKTTGSGALALLGLTLSYPITVLVTRRAWTIDFPLTVDRQELWFISRHGFTASVATVVTLLLPTLLRIVTTAKLGAAEGAGVLLAIDLSMKAIGLVGLAVNILTLQKAIHSAEFGTDTTFQRQARLQVSLSTYFVLGAMVGFIILQDSFSKLFVASEYFESYNLSILLCSLAAGALTLRQYALDSLFIVNSNSAATNIGPATTAVVFTVASIFFAIQTPGDLSKVYAAAALVGTCGSLITAFATIRLRWPVLDLLKCAIALCVMAATGLLTSLCLDRTTFGPMTDVFVVLAVAGLSYAAVGYLFNIGGIKSIVSKAHK